MTTTYAQLTLPSTASPPPASVTSDSQDGVSSFEDFELLSLPGYGREESFYDERSFDSQDVTSFEPFDLKAEDDRRSMASRSRQSTIASESAAEPATRHPKPQRGKKSKAKTTANQNLDVRTDDGTIELPATTDDVAKNYAYLGQDEVPRQRSASVADKKSPWSEFQAERAREERLRARSLPSRDKALQSEILAAGGLYRSYTPPDQKIPTLLRWASSSSSSGDDLAPLPSPPPPSKKSRIPTALEPTFHGFMQYRSPQTEEEVIPMDASDGSEGLPDGPVVADSRLDQQQHQDAWARPPSLPFAGPYSATYPMHMQNEYWAATASARNDGHPPALSSRMHSPLGIPMHPQQQVPPPLGHLAFPHHPLPEGGYYMHDPAAAMLPLPQSAYLMRGTPVNMFPPRAPVQSTSSRRRAQQQQQRGQTNMWDSLQPMDLSEMTMADIPPFPVPRSRKGSKEMFVAPGAERVKLPTAMYSFPRMMPPQFNPRANFMQTGTGTPVAPSAAESHPDPYTRPSSNRRVASTSSTSSSHGKNHGRAISNLRASLGVAAILEPRVDHSVMPRSTASASRKRKQKEQEEIAAALLNAYGEDIFDDDMDEGSVGTHGKSSPHHQSRSLLKHPKGLGHLSGFPPFSPIAGSSSTPTIPTSTIVTKPAPASKTSKAASHTAKKQKKNTTTSPTSTGSSSSANAAVPPPTPAKRQPQVQHACTNCKDHHFKCDTARPCKRCVEQGRDDCVDRVHKQRGRPKNSKTKNRKGKPIAEIEADMEE
ncbi:hypothetical protein HKX48_009515 [Thoreauomyces humboldtii]|nr:hypothetical protein HKX48_009515 [Thoreauomyces humboldtii]